MSKLNEEPNIEELLSESEIDDSGSETSSVVEGGNDDDYFEGGAEGEAEDEDDDEGSVDVSEHDDDEEGIPTFAESDGDDEDDEEEEEDDDNYLQKLDDHVRKKVIEDHHPELRTLNYEEVEALATVVRDKDNVIIDPLHRTIPVLTRYEKARALGERARQINSGARPFIDVDATMIDGYLIALKELEQKRIPFIIQRPLPNGGSEYWRMADLELL
jgi:DNA-directed RNA polymerase I, II, and III subunit RPABC2